MKPVVRFALGPTGGIHIGNLRLALLNWLFARRLSHSATTGRCHAKAPYKSLTALASLFDFDKLTRAPARFDTDELKSPNARLLQDLDYGDAAGRLDVAALELLLARRRTAATWGEWTESVKKPSGIKGRALCHPLRMALAGHKDGPELKHLLPVIGRSKAAAHLGGAAA